MSRLKLTFQTQAQAELLEITAQVEEELARTGLAEGLLHLYTPHTTCGLTINENADPDVARDLLTRLEELAPWRHPQDRHREGNSAAHLKSSLLGCQLTLPVQNHRLQLGTWQGVYLCEFDGPRNREVFLTPIPSNP